MKGFTITPIVVLGLFFIVAILLLNFSDLDRRVIQGLTKENTINGLSSSLLENKTSQGDLLLYYTIEASNHSTTTDLIKANVEKRLGKTINITFCDENYFIISNIYQFSKKSTDTNISTPLEIEKKITCELIKDVEDVPPGFFITCSDSSIGTMMSC